GRPSLTDPGAGVRHDGRSAGRPLAEEDQHLLARSTAVCAGDSGEIDGHPVGSIAFSMATDSSSTPSGNVMGPRSTSTNPYREYSGNPGRVAMRASFVKPSSRAADSHATRIRVPRPRRVQSSRTNIARTRAGSVAG